MQILDDALSRQSRATHLTHNHWKVGLLLSVLLPVVVVALTLPIVRMPINDGWSYAWTAMMLARTGQLHYNGWGAPMLGLQAYWAALFIRIFGFSFLLVRTTTLLFAIAASVGIYGIASHFRVSPANALITSTAVVCSPLFVPLAASYMTDVPGLALLLLTVLAILKSVSAKRATHAAAYLALAAIIGLAAGSIRQNLWLVPLILLPAAALYLRSDPRRAAVAVIIWLASVCAVLWMTVWFARQPYALIEYPLDARLIPTRIPAGTAWRCIVCLLKSSLLLLPVILIRWRAVSSARCSRVAAVSRAVCGNRCGHCIPARFSRRAGVWLDGQSHHPYGLFTPNEVLIGDRIRLLSPVFCIFLSTLATLTLAAILTCGWLYLPRIRHAAPNVQLLLLAVVAYLIFVLIRAAGNAMFDRYLLPLVALSAILLMLLPGVRISRLGLCVLVLFGLYAIATTHDYFALCRARLAAAETLMSHDIDRREICAGVEFDGWTQLLARGHIRSQAVPIDQRRPRPIRPPMLAHF